MKLTLTALLACLCLSAQAQDPTPAALKPTYVIAGLSYNQYTGGSGFVSVITPEVKSAGVYASLTADVVPVKFTDAKTGKSGYVMSFSPRFGQHKQLYWDGKNMVLLGGDAGASFSQSTSASSPGTNIGLAGSFTLTYARQLSPHWGIAVPVRMLYLSGAGPDGKGAFNPVVQFGVVYKP